MKSVVSSGGVDSNMHQVYELCELDVGFGSTNDVAELEVRLGVRKRKHDRTYIALKSFLDLRQVPPHFSKVSCTSLDWTCSNLATNLEVERHVEHLLLTRVVYTPRRESVDCRVASHDLK